MPDALIVRADENHPFQQVPGGTQAFLTVGSETGGALECAVATLRPQGRHPMHLHPDQDEALFVLQGTIRLQIDDEHHTLTAGDFAFIPWGTLHAMVNPAATAAQALTVYTPSGLFSFCRAMMDRPAARFEDLAAHPASRSQPPVGPPRHSTN
jgi:quercetin dioxygenase-like cupin family protein